MATSARHLDSGRKGEKEKEKWSCGAVKRVKGDNCDGHDLVFESHARLRGRGRTREKEILIFHGSEENIAFE